MKIAVICGSPKKIDLSVTMQHVRFLMKQFQKQTFEILPVSNKIRKIENDNEYFNSILDIIKKSDVILWAFPVYFYMIPGQLKKFIEFVIERDKHHVFKDKYSTAILTSAMIFDYHAHEYIHAISEDLGMSFIPGFSFSAVADKQLLNKDFQVSLKLFFDSFLKKAYSRSGIQRSFLPVKRNIKKIHHSIQDLPDKNANGKKLLLLTNQEKESNLEYMVDIFTGYTNCNIEIININDIDIKSGCIGCVKCHYTARCNIADDMNDLYFNKIQNSDCIVFAVTIKDRHLSADWKMFFDRTFFNAQLPVLKNKYSAFLVSGPLMETKFVFDFINIYTSCRFMTQIGYVSDENVNNNELVDYVKKLAEDIDFYVEKNIKKTYSGYSYSYHCVVRDVLYILSSAKQSPYNYYKKNKLLDYPNKKIKYIFQHHLYNFVFNFPGLKDKIKKNALNILIKPYNALFK